MKPRADVNEQNRVLTFTFNIPMSDKPIEIAFNSSKRRRQKQLEQCTPKGHELIKKLLGMKGVTKVNISLYEVEVVFTEQYNSRIRRDSIDAIMEAVGGTLRIADEHVIVTTDASREEDIPPYVDPPAPEN